MKRSVVALVLTSCVASSVSGQRIRPRARDPLARFAKMLASDDVRAQWQAVHGLVEVGAPAVPHLVRILESEGADTETPSSVELAAETLARLKGAALAAIPRLIALVRRGTAAQQFHAIRVLGHVAPFRSASVATAREAIVAVLCRDATPRSDWPRIAPALARLDADPGKILTIELMERLATRDVTRRLQAAEWLAPRIEGAQRKLFLAKLANALKERQPRHTAFDYRFKTLDYWRVVQTHRAEESRRAIAEILLRCGSDVPLPGWIALARHRDPAMRQRAALALGASGKSDAVLALIEQLRDRDRVVVCEAITALGMLGPLATSARAVLEAIADGEEKDKAARAKAALKRIGG